VKYSQARFVFYSFFGTTGHDWARPGRRGPKSISKVHPLPEQLGMGWNASKTACFRGQNSGWNVLLVWRADLPARCRKDWTKKPKAAKRKPDLSARCRKHVGGRAGEPRICFVPIPISIWPSILLSSATFITRVSTVEVSYEQVIGMCRS
jgi:hypothetical protein